MGFFSFFSKEKKETLDKGLSKTKESVFGKIARAIAGKSKVDDEVLDNLEEVLITSDVGVETTLKIIERIEKRAADEKYMNAKELNVILRDEIAALLTENNSDDVDDFEDDFEDDFDFEFGDAEEVKQEGASDEEAVTATSEDEE